MLTTVLAVLGLAATLSPQQDSLRIQLKPLWTIGSAEDTAVSFSRLGAPQIATDAQGLVYIIDADRFRVLVVNSAGQTVRTLGRKGGGPGELELPFSLAISPGGIVSVYDGAKRALVRFDRAGKPLPQLTLTDQGIVQQVYAQSDSTYLISATLRDSVRLSELRGTSTIPLLTLPLPARKPTSGAACGLLGHAREPYFSARLLWTASPGAVIANTDGSFMLHRLVPAGGPDFGRTATRTSTSSALAKAYYGDSDRIFVGGGSKPCFIPLEGVLRDVGMASMVPAYDRLITLNGRIWALRLVPQGAPRIADLYSMTGSYLGSVQMGAGTPVGYLPGRQLLTIEKDPDDVLYLQASTLSGLD